MKQHIHLGLILAILVCFCVIALGVFTRLSHAGLGCPDWPGCYGHLLWPNDPSEIALANQAFQGFEVDNSKTWPEMIHRYAAALLGLCIFYLSYLFFRFKQASFLSYSISALVIFQAALGRWTVTLKLWPQVVSLHLLSALCLLGLLFLLLRRNNNTNNTQLYHDALHSRPLSNLYRLTSVIFGLICLQIFIGVWMSSNYAAIACTDFPLCQGQLFPRADFSQGFNLLQAIGPNYLGGELSNEARVAIHISHRFLALIITLLSVFAILYVRQSSRLVKHKYYVFISVLTLQIGLGIANIIWQFPLAIALGHTLVAALLSLSLIDLLLCLSRLQTAQFELSKLDSQHPLLNIERSLS